MHAAGRTSRVDAGGVACALTALLALSISGCVGPGLRQLPAAAPFTIRSQLPRRYDARLTHRLKSAYADVATLFNHVGDAPWPGQCDVRCYTSRREFERAVAQLGKVAAHAAARAYQIATGSEVIILVHSPGWFDHDAVFPSLAHEVAHAFLAHYGGPGLLPAWVQEGLAQHIEFKQPESRPDRIRHTQLASAGWGPGRAQALSAALMASSIPADSPRLYALAWRLVEELLSQEPGSFSKFVLAMKQGESVNAALRRVYGWGAGELVRRCAQ